MILTEKIAIIRDFLKKGLWQVEANQHAGRVRRFFIRELQMAVLVIKSGRKHFLFSRAASLAFTTLISMIPVLAILFMVFKAFGGEMVETRIKPLIYEYLTAGIGDSLSGYIDSFLYSATVDTLGTIGVIFLFAGVYSILSSIESTFNAIWQVRRNRPPVEMLKTYLTIVFISPVLLVLSIWLTVRLERLVSMGDELFSGFSNMIVVHLIPFILVNLLFLSLITIMPNTRVRIRHAFKGAVFGAFAYTLLKELFLYYTGMAVSYNLIYGSLAILPFFMLWIYFSWVVVLLSVEIAYVRQNSHCLMHLEQEAPLNRTDRLRIAFMILLTIIKNFMTGKEQPSQSEISEKLDIPVQDISETLDTLEKSGIIAEMARKPDTYTLSLPPDRLTVGRVMDAVDRMYLKNREFQSEKDFGELSDIFSEKALKAGPDDRVTGFIRP